MLRGRLVFSLNTTVSLCNIVPFPSPFPVNQTVHVLLSVNYYNTSGNFFHDTAVAWTEKVSSDAFTACVLKAGRNDRFPPDGGLTFVDYVVFQGNPIGAVVGREVFSDWWDGTTCESVTLPQVRKGWQRKVQRLNVRCLKQSAPPLPPTPPHPPPGYNPPPPPPPHSEAFHYR